jgi:hypothetical protein
LKKRPFWEERAPRQALALGLVVLVGLGGYAWHRTNRRPQLPSKAALARWTPAPSPSSPASPAPTTAAAATPAWETVLPTVGDDLQPAPSPGEANGIAVEQPASSRVQTDPPTPIGPAAPAASAASATQDLTLPPTTTSPSPSPAQTPGETTPVPEGGPAAAPRAAVPPAPPASHPPTPDDPAVRGREDGVAATPDKVPEGGGERLEGAPGAVSAQQDDPAAAFTPAPPQAQGAREAWLQNPPARPTPAAAHVLATTVWPQGNQETRDRQTPAVTPHGKDAPRFVRT